MQPVLIPLPVVQAITGKGRSNIYKEVKAKTFPQPVATSSRSRRWVQHEVESWVAAKIAARDQKTQPTPTDTVSGPSCE
jgi:prophage regulatory protein